MRRLPTGSWPSLLAALLGGCGFHLQGRAPLPALVKNPYVEAPDRQTDFVQSLRHDLLQNGAQPVPLKAQASAVISILQDQMVRRTVSVSASNQPNLYEITYTVRVAVSAGDKELLPAQELIGHARVQLQRAGAARQGPRGRRAARGHGARSRRPGDATAVETLVVLRARRHRRRPPCDAAPRSATG